MCIDASCSPRRSIGETSATNRHATPVIQSTSLPTGAARAPPSAREMRHRHT